MRLYRTGVTFYLSGPNIERLAATLPETFHNFIKTNYATVISDITQIPHIGKWDAREKQAALVRLCTQLEGPTLIYCQSPNSARRYARALVDGLSLPLVPDLAEPAAWIGREFHPQWMVGQALARGVGIHHGRMPRSLGQFVVRAFNDGLIKWLFCTSTLIEGVTLPPRTSSSWITGSARTDGSTSSPGQISGVDPAEWGGTLSAMSISFRINPDSNYQK